MSDEFVTLKRERYDELLDLETRVNVIVERLYHDAFMVKEDFLWLLGTELAVQKAYEIREEEAKCGKCSMGKE